MTNFKKILLTILAIFVILSCLVMLTYRFYVIMFDMAFDLCKAKPLACYIASYFSLAFLMILSSRQFHIYLSKDFREQLDTLGLAVVPFFILLFPKRVFVYIFYLCILLFNHISVLAPNLVPSSIRSIQDLDIYLKANEYTIVVLIAVERIISNFKSEKNQINYLKELNNLLSKLFVH